MVLCQMLVVVMTDNLIELSYHDVLDFDLSAFDDLS